MRAPASSLKRQHFQIAGVRRSPTEGAGLQVLLRLVRQVDASISSQGGHSGRVADWAARTAHRLRLTEREVRTVYWAARLHDVGKIGIPEEILTKEGSLTRAEWILVKLHPLIGANLVRSIQNIAHLAPVVRAHQEKFDGTGYPSGLKGADIPLGARLLAVVDAYEAMTTDRVYQRARNHAEALSELERCSGRQFDPDIVDAFVEVVGLPG